MTNPIIVGTLALDSLQTPFGKRENVLGGSACFASLAASYFAKPGIISIVGDDFPKEHLDFLKSRSIDLAGVEKKGKTFRWSGSYEYDMNEAKTLQTELNALTEFSATVPDEYKTASHIFLGNIDPTLQIKVIEQIERPELIIIDTMNLWIQHARDTLLKAIGKADILVFNEGEARMLFNTPNLVTAAKESLKLGLKAVIIKKGEHGSLMFTKDGHFNAPGYPLENVMDPTGCGDSFGGGLMGYLAKNGSMDERALCRGMVLGSTIASFTAEDFSVDRLRTLRLSDIEERFAEMRKLREF